MAGTMEYDIFILMNKTTYLQSITGFNPPDSIAFNPAVPLVLSAKASSGLPVTYGSNNSSVISINGAKGTTKGLGVVTITANQVGGGYYLPVSVSAIVAVVPGPTTPSPPTSISEADQVGSVKIYPNPSSGRFTVKGASSVIVFDLLGNEVIKTNDEQFYISARGLYIAEVQTKAGKKRMKLVVE